LIILMRFGVKRRLKIRCGPSCDVSKFERAGPATASGTRNARLRPALLGSVGTIARESLDGDFGALARGFGDFFYAGVDYFADGFQEFDARVC
jgi:hypothetical protein